MVGAYTKNGAMSAVSVPGLDTSIVVELDEASASITPGVEVQASKVSPAPPPKQCGNQEWQERRAINDRSSVDFEGHWLRRNRKEGDWE